MLLLDVNVLVYAFREDSPDHERYAAWVQSLVDGQEPFGIPEMVLSGFIRIVTHPGIFKTPSSIDRALAFTEQVRRCAGYTRIVPSPRHWALFVRLCRDMQAQGNLVSDAYLAAMAIELDAEWFSTDHHYARFPGLKWRHPLQGGKGQE